VQRAVMVALALSLCVPHRARAWSGQTHRKLTSDALQSMRWIDRYGGLKVTPFASMVRDVLGPAPPVEPDAFRFWKAETREAKHRSYMRSTAAIEGPAVRKFARHLFLSNQLSLRYTLGERSRPVSARQVLTAYSAEPDWGMDKGLDASWHQTLMGGMNPAQTSSQGFRHMSFLLGAMGEAPRRAQLFFDLGARAINRGHAYWGFRFMAWGLHFVEDMGTPVHTNMLPTSKYIRLKGMVRPGGRLNRSFLGDLVRGSAQINANYHFLYEDYVDRAYAGGSEAARSLSAAVRGDGRPPGAFLGRLRRLLAPRSMKAVAKRRAWSRLSTPGIARNAVRLFTEKFRTPAPGAPSNTVRSVNPELVRRTVDTAGSRLVGESPRAYQRRMKARDTMMRRTQGQFRKTGVAVRRVMDLLRKKIR